MRIEMESMKCGVGVTTVAPYYINTGMFQGVQSRFFPILKPEEVARKVFNAIEKNHKFRGIPFSFHIIRFCQAILPFKLFDLLFGEFVELYHAMDNFTGRKAQ